MTIFCDVHPPHLVSLASYTTDDNFKLLVNNREFFMPTAFAISFSNKILQTYLTDKAIKAYVTSFKIKEDKTYKMIGDLIKNGGLNNSYDMKCITEFFDFIDSMECHGILNLFKEKFDAQNLDFHVQYFKYCFMADHESSTKIIAENFCRIPEEKLLNSCYAAGAKATNMVLKHKSLFVKWENNLVEFITKIISKDASFVILLENVIWEYVSEPFKSRLAAVMDKVAPEMNNEAAASIWHSMKPLLSFDLQINKRYPRKCMITQNILAQRDLEMANGSSETEIHFDCFGCIPFCYKIRQHDEYASENQYMTG
ncbi:hypothetical protein TVAG_114710 [Trichomonas vaginalis G3]|uniref:BTB domain-containing protein n=1 Tax=Trichomonas vaginalis (strain ATCC PRA-98 / G3) TaxID=412133 RepID=A2FGJ4_TRIV3|nr:histone-lysine N-methyltransferase family [Trichomonas vaginalis G3]EAX95960.1 hypothetical protein TVAG_114710 [Trichomonas vaginalis G3]KAI5540459.1 histone-lysine N-methyltransferase family [Trichomonas vaginalis G3]|eukprot:XP_001308890.1 hypothetical protein [Trichomonas vaginalis G3]